MEPVNDSDSSDDDDSVDSSSSSDNSSDDNDASHSSDDSINSQQDDLDNEHVSVDQQQTIEDDSENSENSFQDSQEEYQDEYKSLRERILEKEARGSKKYSARRSEQKSKALQKAMKGLESFKKKRKLQQQNAEKKNNDTIQQPPKKKKKSKHKPTEVSSKRADFFARGAKRFHESGLGVDDIGTNRYKPMDPRLSNLTGRFDEDRFSRNYAFLEEMRNQEIGQLRKQLQAHKQTGKKGNRMRRKHQLQHIDMEETQTKLKALTETRANLERQKMDRAAKQSVKRKLKEQVESGKGGVYFLKRKEKKRLELEAKYEQMSQKHGGKDFQKTLAKKRQKNKSKDAGVFVK